jgi:hypothetical protein
MLDAIMAEIQRKDCLDVFRFDGYDDAFVQLFYRERVAVDSEVLTASFQNLVLFEGTNTLGDYVETQERIPAQAPCHRLTTVVACETMAHKKASDEDENHGSQHCDRCEQLCVNRDMHFDGHHIASRVEQRKLI